MLDALNITEEQVAGLDEIAAFDLALARTFAAKAQAAEDPDEANRLARSYHRCARSYRQTLLLKTRLRREIGRALAEGPEAEPERRPPPSPAMIVRVSDRVTELHNTALKVAWAEYLEVEQPDYQIDGVMAAFCEGLDAWTNRACVAKGFADRPFEEHFLDLCRELELDPGVAARWRDLPTPPEEAWRYPPAPPEPRKPKPEASDSEGYWFKPEGWKPGDPYGYHRPP